MRLKRSNDSSSPIVNMSATTPKAAMRSIASTLIASALSHGAFRRDRAEAIGSERDAREQVAQDRTDAQPEEQRRDHARRHQEQQRLLVDRKVDRLVHLTPRRISALVMQSSLFDSRSKGSVAARALAC